MSTRIHINPYVVTDVEVERNSSTNHLVALRVTEESRGGHTSDTEFTMTDALWQQVANRLAAVGITAHAEVTA